MPVILFMSTISENKLPVKIELENLDSDEATSDDYFLADAGMYLSSWVLCSV